MKPRIGSIWCLLAAVFLGGCAGWATGDEKKARDDLKSSESTYRPHGARPVLPPLTATSTLSDLIHYALLSNPKVESAFYEWKGSVEAITAARSLPDPMLNLSIEIMNSLVALTPALMTDPMSNWPWPEKLSLRADAAYAEATKRRAALEDELLSTALAVKRAYYQLWTVDEQIRRTREILVIIDEMERLARERLEVGKVTQQDVLRAQMERDQTNNQLANLEDSRGTIIARLRSALGLTLEEALPQFVVHLEPTPQDFTESSLKEVAFAQNRKLREMRSEVEQATAAFELARKSTIPDFSFGMGADTNGPSIFMPSVGISLPIWRDKIAAEIARGRAGVDAAEARFYAEKLDLAVRFAETAFAWREADRGVRLYGERLIPKADASLGSARAGYSAGMSSFLDLLEAERALLDYRLNHAISVGRRETVLAEMSLVILGRWPQGVADVPASR